MLGSWSVSVVPPFPSGMFHVAAQVKPTPVAIAWQFAPGVELRSLNGVPKKPHTTGRVAATSAAEPWMWAAVRLSFGSVVCVPVKSMLWIVATKVSDDWSGLSVNEAKPYEAGRGVPSAKVGTAGGDSCAFVMEATNVHWASAVPAAPRVRASSGTSNRWGR